ncbi:tyrosine-type recombinase/integrase [Acinetobacter chinensis]|uniref:tyrosine-type recombinase/integrase n=1 Tax=Acinetobacter chinensis TaxID=2004650 RepID=UPI0029346F47|nr:tyrosine-type recombinase/integrase [Acinetobacter chinensis]WOE40111.1 tyrosine-type recombinase/integrase [Acinetobacter chinensis]
MKLNKSNVDSIELIDNGQKIIRDSELSGFAVRVTKKSKSYIVERRFEGELYRVVIGKTTDISVASARAKAQMLLAKISNGEYTKATKNSIDIDLKLITVDQALNIYIEKNEFKPKTIRQYKKFVDLYLKWGNMKLFSITRQAVLNKFIEISLISKSSANGSISLIGTLWKYINIIYSTDKEQLNRLNPVDVISVTNGWNVIKRRERYLHKDVIFKYYNAVINYQDELNLENTARSNTHRDIILFTMYTGCRKQEVCQLKWQDIDFNDGLILFADTKNGTDHLFPVGNHLLSILKDRYLLRENDWVFPATKMPTSSNVHATQVDTILKKVGAEVDYYVSMHDFRRTFATICNLLRFNIYVTKRLLNHTAKPRIDVTGGYVQIPIEELRSSMNMIEAVYQQKIDCFNYESVWDERLKQIEAG